MDDLTSKLSEFLKNPESLEKIKNFASMLGTEGEPEIPISRPAPQQEKGNPPSAPQMDPEILGAVMKMAPTLSRLKQEDDSTRLLRALRPFLGDERKKKLDEAIRLMQLVRMAPLFKSSGLF